MNWIKQLVGVKPKRNYVQNKENEDLPRKSQLKKKSLNSEGGILDNSGTTFYRSTKGRRRLSSDEEYNSKLFET
jgi:hypothetical protein